MLLRNDKSKQIFRSISKGTTATSFERTKQEEHAQRTALSSRNTFTAEKKKLKRFIRLLRTHKEELQYYAYRRSKLSAFPDALHSTKGVEINVFTT
ncbi:hypothetical protein QE152_g26030 [Popillia japonica]|uniref:Ribosomal protein S14 n=1 Tax=Popillia japonica TaxID=7064 RepID=A0AAW1JZK7_POPJA